jgi:hypothetical protein
MELHHRRSANRADILLLNYVGIKWRMAQEFNLLWHLIQAPVFETGPLAFGQPSSAVIPNGITASPFGEK